jgi:hypothetical protein
LVKISRRVVECSAAVVAKRNETCGDLYLTLVRVPPE